MQKIIFDCDNTVGIEGYPMDDALAFLYLLGNRGRAQVLAFCCTFGNGTAQQVYESSRQLPKSPLISESNPEPKWNVHLLEFRYAYLLEFPT